MLHKSPQIIFFGTEDYSLSTLRALVEHGFAIAAVVTKPDTKRGRGQNLTEPPVKIYAREHNIPVWQPQKLNDIADDIRALQPVAGVLVAYGKIIPQSIIDLFSPGIINLHPSLLPRWRGPSPIEAAISHRDNETGISIMQLEAGMDSGPLYTQQQVPLDGTETKPQLYDQLFDLGNTMMIDILPDILSGSHLPTPQDESQASYCSLLSKNDSLLDPATMTAPEAHARIRAHLGFPRSRIALGEHVLIITRAHVIHDKTAPLAVQFKDGAYLVIDELVAQSGKTMTAEAYVHGLRR